MADSYIQHNPISDTGIQGFRAYFTAAGLKPQPIKDHLDNLVAIQAEGNYVTLSFRREYNDPNKPGQKYTTTWFDIFRVENGKIAEHWDSATMIPRK
jgi:predicted SnoaL-like aldol condensation-catalyzing enzyme